MGLTVASVGRGSLREGIQAPLPEGCVPVALAGNPNVGKSTLFNCLTGMKQHTGNWPGKTVAVACGLCSGEKGDYMLVDLPGTYSLRARSAEEEIARDHICFGGARAVAVVCDGGCLERNLPLALQVMETAPRVLLCVNLMDEAERKGVHVDLEELSRRLSVPVVGISARDKKSRGLFMAALEELAGAPEREERFSVRYPPALEAAAEKLLPGVERAAAGRLPARWLSLRLLEGDEKLIEKAEVCLEGALEESGLLQTARKLRRELEAGDRERTEDMLSAGLVNTAEELCRGLVKSSGQGDRRDRKLDKLLTGRLWAFPLMLLLLALIFYISIVGANYPSRWLSALLMGFEPRLTGFLVWLGAPPWLQGLLSQGAYRVLAWVVSVMLPPMAIFFPLFTLLEDAGYLPRVAYNLDGAFRRCGSCGKQALTMCMGFGCNAAGAVGCRIIDSRRERLLALLTNSFVPCNGRFPTLIAMISMFFVAERAGALGPALSALMLTGLIAFAVLMSLAATKLLSRTLLRGLPSSFVLELPPYRRPQIGRVLLRSVFDRTLYVLGRAAAVAAPAGALLWLTANMSVNGQSIISLLSAWLEPLGRFMGLDGVILLAFILGFPANEIVLPIIIMIYTAQGSLTELGELGQIRLLLSQNGWTWCTALCVMVFSIMHWPCSTTLLTIKKESGSLKWSAAAFLLPTAAGFVCCTLISALYRLAAA